MFSRLAGAKLLIPTVFAAFGFAILIGLGSWQWSRLAWKEQILATIKTRLAMSPIGATATWPGLQCHDETTSKLANPCEYQMLSLRGTFDHSQERHIFTAAPQVPGLAADRGYWVFTPLRLDGSSKSVYVNRGFVPENLKRPSDRVLGQTSQKVDVVGLYRSAQIRATFDGQPDKARNIWYVRNPAELWESEANGAELNEMWAYIDQTAPTPAGGWPLPLAGKIDISNRHLEYALTWYGLALTLLGVWSAYVWDRLKPQAKPV